MRVTESCPCGANLDVEDCDPAIAGSLLQDFRHNHSACRVAVAELAAELADRDL